MMRSFSPRENSLRAPSPANQPSARRQTGSEDERGGGKLLSGRPQGLRVGGEKGCESHDAAPLPAFEWSGGIFLVGEGDEGPTVQVFFSFFSLFSFSNKKNLVSLPQNYFSPPAPATGSTQHSHQIPEAAAAASSRASASSKHGPEHRSQVWRPSCSSSAPSSTSTSTSS